MPRGPFKVHRWIVISFSEKGLLKNLQVHSYIVRSFLNFDLLGQKRSKALYIILFHVKIDSKCHLTLHGLSFELGDL